MSTLLQMLNHLLSAWLSTAPADGTWQLRQASLTAEGGHLRGRVDHPLAEGEFILSMKIEPLLDGRQDVILRIDQWPDKLPPLMESLRPLLEHSTLRAELRIPDDGGKSSPPTKA